MQANAPNCAVKTDSHDPARGQSADGDEIPSLAVDECILALGVHMHRAAGDETHNGCHIVALHSLRGRR